MTSVKRASTWLVTAALACGVVVSAAAQEGNTGGGVFGHGSQGTWMNAGIPAHRAGTNENCPALYWDIKREAAPDGTYNLSGPIWYGNGTGVSFARGTGQANGTFSVDVSSVSGKGPTGTLAGRRFKNGSIDVKVDGSPCFSGSFHLNPGQTSARL